MKEWVLFQNSIKAFVWSKSFLHDDKVVFTYYNITVSGKVTSGSGKKGNAFWKDCRTSFWIVSGNFGTQLPITTSGFRYVILNTNVKIVLVWLDKCWFFLTGCQFQRISLLDAITKCVFRAGKRKEKKNQLTLYSSSDYLYLLQTYLSIWTFFCLLNDSFIQQTLTEGLNVCYRN